MTRHHFAHLITLSALALWPVAHAQDVNISPQEIKATWSDKAINGVIQGGPLAGKSIEMHLKSDSSADIGGAITDTGTWRLSDSGYCATWKKIRAGQERCFTVIRKGTEQHVFNPDGSLNSIVTQVR
jgi:hypothetical protein